MLKKIDELNDQENLELLRLIGSGEIDDESLEGNVLFAVQYSDYFLGLETVSNQIIDDQYEKLNVICLGESRLARDNMEKIGSIELVDLVDNVPKVTSTIKYNRDNFK